MRPPEEVKPPTARGPQYIEVLEQNAHIIYPTIGALVVMLLVVGILQAWRTQDLDGLQKAEVKRAVILELRRQMSGLPVDALSKAVGIEPFKLVRVLEEMQRDGVLGSHTNTQRLTTWMLKGVTMGGPRQR
jgi:hypothetical protein